MSYCIVHDYVSDAINAKLDIALAGCPDAAKDRGQFYQTLLEHYNEHGEIPEFNIVKKDPTNQTNDH